jgi:hypothetical protein
VADALHLLLALLPTLPAPASPGGAGGCREAFEEAAERLEAIDYGDVLYGRVGTPAAVLARERAADEGVLADLLARVDPPEEVQALLAHPDPRVRGLALVELFDREDPRLLPQLVRLADDEGAAVPQAPIYTAALVTDGNGWKRVPETPPPPQPRTVGQVAQQLVGFHLERAGFLYGIEGYRDHPGWEVYWAERAEREWCASWLAVAQLRAFGGTSPLPEGAGPRLRALRARVDALPEGERELVLLWLPDLDGVFSTQAERLEAARGLGRARLLAILRREPETDDPDLVPRTDANAGRYPLEQVARFILGHADALLAPEDVPTLLTCQAHERALEAAGHAWPMDTALWRLAVARLDRERALEHLERAWEESQEHDWPAAALDRMAILETAWELLGARADAWVSERFWAETRRASYWPYGPTSLVDRVSAEGTPEGRRRLAALLRHPGFAGCDVVLLQRLARRVDAWTEPDVVGEESLRRAWHPLGLGRLATADQRARAAEQYPVETRAVLDLVSAWRERLLESVPRWAPAGR